MIKYQLNITLYEKISLYSMRFDISLSQACWALAMLIRLRLNYQLLIALPWRGTLPLFADTKLQLGFFF